MLKKLQQLISPKKPDPSEYSTIVGKGSVVAVQVEAYFLALNKYIENMDKIIDVGFGLGYGINIISIKASEVYGVDVDKKVYDYCMNSIMGKNPKLKQLSVYNGYDLPFPDNYFDVVTSIDVVEHVEDYNKFIKELLRVSKRGVFISTPNRRPEYTNEDGTPRNYWHLREWSFTELDNIVSKFGKIDWNFINGCYDGPFTLTNMVTDDTLALSPFIYKYNQRIL